MTVELTHKFAAQFVSFDVTLPMAFNWKVHPSARARQAVNGLLLGIHTVKVLYNETLVIFVVFRPINSG